MGITMPSATSRVVQETVCGFFYGNGPFGFWVYGIIAKQIASSQHKNRLEDTLSKRLSISSLK
jgi:hypothetical protein